MQRNRVKDAEANLIGLQMLRQFIPPRMTNHVEMPGALNALSFGGQRQLSARQQLGISTCDAATGFRPLVKTLELHPERGGGNALHAIVEADFVVMITLARTVMTSLTLLIALMPLLLFGPASLFGLTVAIVGGIFIGTYSSVYMAAPILIWLKVSSDSFVPKESEMDRQERLARERS